MKVTGVEGIVRAFRRLAGKAKPAQVLVGYRMEYAVYVHENLEARHPNGGQAKYLEAPARRMRHELGRQVRADMRAGMTMEQALYRAGLKLQAASQELVPVDTGALKASAFTEVK